MRISAPDSPGRRHVVDVWIGRGLVAKVTHKLAVLETDSSHAVWIRQNDAVGAVVRMHDKALLRTVLSDRL